LPAPANPSVHYDVDLIKISHKIPPWKQQQNIEYYRAKVEVIFPVAPTTPLKSGFTARLRFSKKLTW
jgi:hypothetical protein